MAFEPSFLGVTSDKGLFRPVASCRPPSARCFADLQQATCHK